MTMSCRCRLALIVSLTWQNVFAQPPSSPTEHQTTIRTTTREVLVDLIVRDKHHHAVTDLRPDEVEIYEDGVKQKVKVFRDVQGAEQLQTELATEKKESSTRSPEAPQSVNTLRQLNFVAVVFAQISPLNLEFARQAVLQFLKSDTLPNTYVTVYRMNRTLDTVQPYTTDRDALTKAVDRAAKGLYTKDGLDVSASVSSSANTALKAWAANVMSSPNAGPATQAAIQNLLLNPLPS